MPFDINGVCYTCNHMFSECNCCQTCGDIYCRGNCGKIKARIAKEERESERDKILHDIWLEDKRKESDERQKERQNHIREATLEAQKKCIYILKDLGIFDNLPEKYLERMSDRPYAAHEALIKASKLLDKCGDKLDKEQIKSFFIFLYEVCFHNETKLDNAIGIIDSGVFYLLLNMTVGDLNNINSYLKLLKKFFEMIKSNNIDHNPYVIDAANFFTEYFEKNKLHINKKNSFNYWLYLLGHPPKKYEVTNLRYLLIGSCLGDSKTYKASYVLTTDRKKFLFGFIPIKNVYT